MKYQLIGTNDYNKPLETFLQNRGVNSIEQYTHLDDTCLCSPYDLDNIERAVQAYLNAIENNKTIGIVIDSDCDGFCSAAMVYNYTKSCYPHINIKYYLHTEKQHGLTDDIEIDDDVELLIIPDAGTNDVEQCKILQERGVNVIVLDHHIQDVLNPYAIIVNNQCSSKYKNTELCGAGIVYKFLQVVDDMDWNEKSDDYLDLVAFANIADCMDVRSLETKYLILKGLSNVANSFFEKLLESQSYYLPEIDTIGIMFYVIPYINALIRIDTQENKTIMFRAFIGDESETFEYKKRGEKEFTQESIYEHAARLCNNAKRRQKTLVDKQLPKIIEHIENKEQDKHEVIITNVTDYVENTMTGVLAIKVAEYFHKPTILLRDRGNDVYGGSVRVPDTSPIENFKNMLNTMTFFSAQGHPSACGTTIFKHNIKESIETLDDYIKEMNLVGIADKPVDFEIEYDDLDMSLFTSIASLKSYYATGLKECNIVVNNIPINADDVVIKGKDSNTWSVMICDETIELIKFRCPENDELLNGLGMYKINIIGKFGYSFFKGIKTAQIIVEDYEVAN